MNAKPTLRFATLVFLGLMALAPSHAVDLKQRIDFDIPAQQLSSALIQFSHQAKVQVVTANDLGDMATSGISGPLAIGDALAQLLNPAGLGYHVVSDTSITIAKIELEGSASIAKHLTRVDPIEDGTATQRTTNERAQAGAAAQTQDSAIEEIIVTAQKRSERLQDVPISISVLNGADLDKSTAQGISEVLNSVPGVATTAYHLTGATQVVVRGVGAASFLTGGSNPIAYYLDSIPFGFQRTALAPDANAYDMERVEVLRGPQGTLYGASAQNGVVRVLTKDPTMDRFEFKARGATSNTKEGGENYRADAAVNVPIIAGKLAARAVVGYDDLSGWIDKPIKQDANDTQLRNYRLKLKAQPTQKLSLGLSAWRSQSDLGAPAQSPGNYQSPSVQEESIETGYDAYGFKLVYDFPAFSLASMSSYIDYDSNSFFDYHFFVANTVLNTRVNSKVFSQEFNLQSLGEGPWRWSVGGIYRDDEDRLYQFRRQNIVPSDVTDVSQSYAVFGELTRAFLDGRLELTGGLRYYKDDVLTHENNTHFTGVVTDPLYRIDNSFQKTSPRLVLTWHANPDLTAYGSYAEGFRSGFNQSPTVAASAPQFPAVKPDNLKNYEVGAKGRTWDGRLAFDVAVFYIDWQDVQQTLSVNTRTPANPLFITTGINGQSASGVGAEFAITAEPIDGLQLGINVGWNDLKLDADVVSSSTVASVVLFPKDNRLSLSPEYTAGGSASYRFALGGGGYRGRLSASANYTSEQVTRTIFPANTLSFGFGDAMTMARAGFSVESPHSWTATVFADNLTNEKGSPYVPPFGFAQWSSRVRPMTVGLQLEYSF